MKADPLTLLAELDPATREQVLEGLPVTHLQWIHEQAAEHQQTASALGELYPWQRVPDGDWYGWAIVGGRGIGKTLGGANWLDQEAQHHPGIRLGIIAPTKPDARATCVEGETGLLAVNPRVHFNRSRLELTWPNGSQARCFGAYTPEDRERLRRAIMVRVQAHWSKRLYDWPQIIGIRLGIPWLQVPGIGICSGLGAILRLVDAEGDLKPHSSPEDVNAYTKARPDRYRVFGRYIPD